MIDTITTSQRENELQNIVRGYRGVSMRLTKEGVAILTVPGEIDVWAVFHALEMNGFEPKRNGTVARNGSVGSELITVTL